MSSSDQAFEKKVLVPGIGNFPCYVVNSQDSTIKLSISFYFASTDEAKRGKETVARHNPGHGKGFLKKKKNE